MRETDVQQKKVGESSDINAVSNVAVEFTTLEDNETVVIKN